MTMSAENCPKCGGEMEVGFILDYTYGANVPSSWVEGEPVKSFWSGTKISGKPRYHVQSFRCVGCGFLESYALENVTDSSIFS